MSDKNTIVGLNMNIDQDYIAEAVKQTVMLGISESLNGKNEIVSQIVKMVLGQKVRKTTGELPASWTSDSDTVTLLEYYVSKMIKEVTQEEMSKLVEEHRKEITTAIRIELQKKANYSKFVDCFIDSITTGLKDKWLPKIDVSFKTPKGEAY